MLLDTLSAFFQEDDWAFTSAGPSVLRLNFEGSSGAWACYAQAFETEQQCIFYSIAPLTAPEEQRVAVAEFLTRANYGLAIGNFELDYADGEVRCKTSLDVEGTELNAALVRRLVYINVLLMDTYLPGLRLLIERGATPLQAITAVEGDA